MYPPHMTCMYPSPHMTCKYPPPRPGLEASEHYLPTNLGPPPGERVPRHSRERAGMGESIGARHPPKLARGQDKDEECRSEGGDASRRTLTHRTLDASSSWLSMNLSLSLSLSANTEVWTSSMPGAYNGRRPGKRRPWVGMRQK